MTTDTRSRILLVEGVPGVGKSTLLDRLLRRYVTGEEEGRLRTVVSLAQTHTYGPLACGEDHGTLTAAENLGHLDWIVSTLEWLAAHAEGQARTKTFVLVDTLHLTHCLRPGVVTWREVAPVDRRLDAIGCRLVLLDAEDDTVRARTVQMRARTEFIRGYALGRFGNNDEELADHFLRERDAFRGMLERTSMRRLRLHAEQAPDDLAAAAAEFWLSGEMAVRAPEDGLAAARCLSAHTVRVALSRIDETLSLSCARRTRIL